MVENVIYSVFICILCFGTRVLFQFICSKVELTCKKMVHSRILNYCMKCSLGANQEIKE